MSDAPDAAAPRRGRLARLSPAHGWRSFWTEIAIVVLGILIALGAQQAVDTWRAHNDVAEFRAALKRELAGNLGAYRGRILQSRCLNARLDELELAQRIWQAGRGVSLSGTIGRPLAFRYGSSTWRTGAAGTASRMELDERLAWANIYDGIETYEKLGDGESAMWLGLQSYDGAIQLSPPEVNALRGMILAARARDRSLRVNYRSMVRRGAAVGVEPTIDAGEQWRASGLCEPLKVGV